MEPHDVAVIKISKPSSTGCDTEQGSYRSSILA